MSSSHKVVHCICSVYACSSGITFFDSCLIIVCGNVFISNGHKEAQRSSCPTICFFVFEDWRDHVDQMHQFSDAIELCMKETRGQLERLADDISRTLEKIASRERYVNQELHYQLNGLKSAHDRRAERKEAYRQASVGLAENTQYLAEVLLSVIRYDAMQ